MRRKVSLIVEPMEGRTLLSGLSYSLTTDRPSYQPGQPIQFTFTETNTGSQPVDLSVGPSTDGFSVSQGGRVIWQSNGGINPMIMTRQTLQPGQSYTQTATWDGTIAQNGTSSLAAGSLAVTNQLAPGAASANFQIAVPLSYGLTAASSNAASGPLAPPIALSYTITNPGSRPVTFSQPPADFVVTAPNGGGTVWQSNPAAASQAPTTETLLPGQSTTESVTWDGAANQGPQAGTSVSGDFLFTTLGAPGGVSQTVVVGTSPTGPVTPPPSQAPPPATPTPTHSTPAPTSTTPPSTPTPTTPAPTSTTPPSTPTPTPTATTPSTPSPTATPTPTPATPAASTDSTATGSVAPAASDPTPAPAPSPSPIAATLMARRTTNRPGRPVHLTLTLANVTGTSVGLSRASRTAVITVRQGSTIVSRTTKALPLAKLAALGPGRSVRLSTVWNGRPNQPGLRALAPGAYTIAFDAAGYSGETSIQIGG